MRSMNIWRYSMIVGIIGRPDKRDDKVLVDTTTNKIRRAIIKNGGIPIVILPPQDINYYDVHEDFPKLTDEEKNMIITSLKLCDALVFQGGNRWYEYDEFICKYAIEHDIPSLMICMSMQLLSCVTMENLKLDLIGGHLSDSDYAHSVNIKEDGILYKILGKDKIMVNSMHRYTVPDTNLFIEATSSDGVIEAISMPSKKFILGLQWHPEKLIDTDDDSNKIFKYFIDIAK